MIQRRVNCREISLDYCELFRQRNVSWPHQPSWITPSTSYSFALPTPTSKFVTSSKRITFSAKLAKLNAVDYPHSNIVCVELLLLGNYSKVISDRSGLPLWQLQQNLWRHWSQWITSLVSTVKSVSSVITVDYLLCNYSKTCGISDHSGLPPERLQQNLWHQWSQWITSWATTANSVMLSPSLTSLPFSTSFWRIWRRLRCFVTSQTPSCIATTKNR